MEVYHASSQSVETAGQKEALEAQRQRLNVPNDISSVLDVLLPSVSGIPSADGNGTVSDLSVRSTPAAVDPTSAVKSKSALKKERRYEKLKATLSQRRAQEKQQRKRKRRATRQRMQDNATDDKPYLSRKVERQLMDEKMKVALTSGVRACVDMSFADIMSPKEIGQLASQIGYMYSTSKRMEHPFCMHLVGLEKDSALYQEVVKRCSGFEYYKIKVFEGPLEQIFSPGDLVYMSPDSPNVLQEVDPSKVYVIGGIVDGTPKKQVSLAKAASLGCQTARLPITEYMTRITPQGYNTILTLNQVYEILMLFHETKSWEAALKPCIPKRKGFQLTAEVAASKEPLTENEVERVEMKDTTEEQTKETTAIVEQDRTSNQIL